MSVTSEASAVRALPNLPVKVLLREGMSPLLARADDRWLKQLEAEYDNWTPGMRGDDTMGYSDNVLHRLILFLLEHVGDDLDEIVRLRELRAGYSQQVADAVTEIENREIVLAFSRALGASQRELAEDERAFRRWFGFDAVLERCQRRVSERERLVTLCLERVGVFAERYVQAARRQSPDFQLEALWRNLKIEAVVLRVLDFGGDDRMATAGLRALRKGVEALPRTLQQTAVSDAGFESIYRAALGKAPSIWQNLEALQLLLPLAQDGQIQILVWRFNSFASSDDMFLRSRVLRLLGERLRDDKDMDEQVSTALQDILHLAVVDDSPFVRQTAARAFANAQTERSLTLLEHMATADDAEEVRAATLDALVGMLDNIDALNPVIGIFREALANEAEPYVIRVIAKLVPEAHAFLLDENLGNAAENWDAAMVTALHERRRVTESVPEKRWISRALERMWVQRRPERRAFARRMQAALAEVPEGDGLRLSQLETGALDANDLGRVLAAIAQEDFGLEVRDNRIQRGHRFGFRWWRFLHELRHPSTDKRQGFRHTIGRRFGGSVHAASEILAEVSETNVPGEPLQLEEEGGWRPYLPLVDEMISALSSPDDVRIFNSEGITIVRRPRGWRQRLRARWRLTFNFPQFSRLRNWRSGDKKPAHAYIDSLRELGFEVEREPYEPAPADVRAEDASLNRFFSPATTSVLVPIPLLEVWNQFTEYFVSLYHNTLRELLAFLIFISVLFFGRHMYANLMFRQARRAMPLVIGGWGSRGKSGTERLKAALLSGLGYHVVSKTTGCEAMFLHGYHSGPLREMFLFRPYDKATIWEQTDVVRIAHKLGAEVFLWECMGLTPAYIEILQRQWMRDDLATITNAYPDHEDLQGPAGINIPQVMTRFIPENSRLVTSEENMLPILKEGARAVNTSVRSVGWYEAGMVPRDIIARFPYEEHPYNIALVTALAEELGVEPDFAWKEMADRVVPDLGSLKAYADASLRGRRLQYVLGNSANERLAAVGNWRRMGFDEVDPATEPGEWISTLVNNRADRVARSRVFASILVNDTPADMHVLIGTNQDGFVSFLHEAWEERMAETSLRTDDERGPQQVFTDLAREFRVPTTEDEMKARLRAMVDGVRDSAPDDDETPAEPAEVNDVDSLRGALEALGCAEADVEQACVVAERYQGEFAQFQAFADKLPSSGGSDALDTEMGELLWSWFEARLVLIPDPEADAEHIIEELCVRTPPGYRNRIMGMQNIKGTGLAHVYAWEDWRICEMACAQLMAADESTNERGLQALSEFQNYNSLCMEHVERTLARFRKTDVAQTEQSQAMLNLIDSNFARARERLSTLDRSGGGEHGIARAVIDGIEAFLDAGEAVRRRKQANRIYRDMVAERISHVRAAKELARVTKEQKGGWLWERLENVIRGAGLLSARG